MSSSFHTFDTSVRTWVISRFRPGISMLDVGPGRGKFSLLLPEYRKQMDCVEIFEPFIAKYNLGALYRHIFIGDIMDFSFRPDKYVLVILGDVLEHLSARDAATLIERIHKSGATILVSVPFMYPQGIIEDNPHEIHKQPDLTPERMAILYPGIHRLISDNTCGIYVSARPASASPTGNEKEPAKRRSHGRAGAAALLLLQNPGNVSPHYIGGLGLGAKKMGINVLPFDVAPVWQADGETKVVLAQRLCDFCLQHDISAVLGYSNIPSFTFPPFTLFTGENIPFFSALGIPQILFWTDHPHWIQIPDITAPTVLSLMANPLCHHFIKSESAAQDLKDVLKWPASHALPMGEDPDLMDDNTEVTPEYDIVAICGSLTPLPDCLNRFLEQDDPDPVEICRTFANTVNDNLKKCLSAEASVRSCVGQDLDAFCECLMETRLQNLEKPIRECIIIASQSFRDIFNVLIQNANCYLDVHRALWRFSGWERTFYLAYLARHFKVAVFGKKCPMLDCTVKGWIDYRQQARVYATGRMAINISQAHDDEGVTHKPFQIAASRIPMLHIYRKGLDQLFTPEREVSVFRRPAEARESAAYLLTHPEERVAMGLNARQRLESEHTWRHRIQTMLETIQVI